MQKIGKLSVIPSAGIDDSMLSIGFECLDRELFSPEKCYDLLGQSGVKWARVQTGWSRCEKIKGVIDFTWLDGIVDNLLKRGVKPWFNVGFGNTLYMDGVPEYNPTAVGCVPLYFGEECVEAWKRFARDLAEHFRGRVGFYEIWNESDITPFWFPETPDPAKLAEFVILTGDIIRKADPDAKIGADTCDINFGYTEGFLRGLPNGYLDFFCFHWYRICAERNYEESVRHLRRVFDRNGFVNTELWLGEGGYPSWFPKGHWMRPAPENDGSEHQQAVYMLRRVLTDAGLSLKRHSYFQIVDLWERPYAKANEVLTKPAAQGILHGITYAPKESYHAICRLANILSGKITPLEAYFGISVNDEKKFGRENISALRRICLKKNGGQLYAWYLPTDIEAERGIVSKLRATFETLEDVRNIDDPVVIDTYTGEVFKPEAEYGRGTADSAAREISLDVPVAEYPFVLCDAKDIRFDAD